MKTTPMENPLSLAVLVVSCDNYSDLWKPFFELFKKFWPGCSYPVYLLSNFKKADIQGISTINVGEDRSWSDNLLYALPLMKEEYVFMFIDDLFINAMVDDARLRKIFTWMINNKANYLRLKPVPKPDKPYNEFIGMVSPGTIYRASTVLSIWKKETLLQLLRSGESAWDFEIKGTIRSDSYDGFYSTKEAQISVINTVIKGKWQRSALRMLEEMGINITSDRKVMTVRESLKLKLLVARFFMLNIIPAPYRRSLKNAIFRGKYDYKLE